MNRLQLVAKLTSFPTLPIHAVTHQHDNKDAEKDAYC